jgi:hypothetical protein
MHYGNPDPVMVIGVPPPVPPRSGKTLDTNEVNELRYVNGPWTDSVPTVITTGQSVSDAE